LHSGHAFDRRSQLNDFRPRDRFIKRRALFFVCSLRPPVLNSAIIEIPKSDLETVGMNVTVEGDKIDYERLRKTIETTGAVINSIDEIVSGDRIVERVKRGQIGWLSTIWGRPYSFPLITGVTDGILTALTFGAGRLFALHEPVNSNVMWRLAAAASLSAGFVCLSQIMHGSVSN
jgi:hypothetical protein